MNQEKLQDALGLLDDDLIAEVDQLRQQRDREQHFSNDTVQDHKLSSIQKSKSSRNWIRWGSLAASLCILIGAASLWALGGSKSADDAHSVKDFFYNSQEKANEALGEMEIYPDQENISADNPLGAPDSENAPETWRASETEAADCKTTEDTATQTTSYSSESTASIVSGIQPPSLLLLTAATEYSTGAAIPATRGGYNWIHDNEDGTTTATIADAAHPLMCRDIMNHFQVTDPTISLEFFNAPGTPEAITVQFWNETHWSDTTAAAEALHSFTFDSTFSAPSLTLKEGGHIYLVTVRWDRGTVDYMFFARYERSKP